MEEHNAGNDSSNNELIDEMNKLVKLVIKKQDESLRLEKQYETKLKNLTLLVEYLMNLRSTSAKSETDDINNSTDECGTNAHSTSESDVISKINTTALDDILLNGLEYCVKDGKKYCMIPVINTTTEPNTKRVSQSSTKTGIINSPMTPSTHQKKKKKNKIPCSYCKETGHTRSKCQKRLQTEKV